MISKGTHSIAGLMLKSSSHGLRAQPPLVIVLLQDRWHAVVYRAHQLVSRHGNDRERADPFAASRVLPVLPEASNAEWRAVVHGGGIRLLRPLALDRSLFEETINRQNAPAAG